MRYQVNPVHRAQIEETAWYMVRGGFDSHEEIVDFIAEVMAEENNVTNIEPLIEHIVDQSFGRHYEQEQTWDAPTDCDKLDEVVENLREAGIVFQVTTGCCSRCALEKVLSDIDEMSGGTEVMGYAFSYRHDIADALRENVLHVSFSALEDGDDEGDEAIGESVVAALKEAGLEPEWSGDPSTRIRVSNFVWRKRREGLSEY